MWDFGFRIEGYGIKKIPATVWRGFFLWARFIPRNCEYLQLFDPLVIAEIFGLGIHNINTEQIFKIPTLIKQNIFSFVRYILA